MSLPNPRFFLAAFAFAISSAAFAQVNLDPSRTAAAVSQINPLGQKDLGAMDSLQAENSFAATSPGDQDIGQQLILKRNEHRTPWTVSLDNSVFYTDNAADAHAGKTADWFWVGGANVDYQPQLTKCLFLDLDVSEHWFEYNRIKDLDFQNGEASGGVILLMPELWNTLWYANYYYERITQSLGSHPIYESQDMRLGVQKNLLLDRLNSINLGAQVAFAMSAEPEVLQRHEYSASIAYNLKIMRDVTFTVSDHLTYYDYFHADRHDWFNNVGAAVVYQPWQWFELALSYNYTYNHSNLESFTYENQLTGPSLTLKAKF